VTVKGHFSYCEPLDGQYLEKISRSLPKLYHSDQKRSDAFLSLASILFHKILSIVQGHYGQGRESI